MFSFGLDKWLVENLTATLILYRFESTWAGRHTLSRMNNDTKLRGEGSKHTGLLFLLDISPRGFSQVLNLLKSAFTSKEQSCQIQRHREGSLYLFSFSQASVFWLCHFHAFCSSKVENWLSGFCQVKLITMCGIHLLCLKRQRQCSIFTFSFNEHSPGTYYRHKNARQESRGFIF